MTSKDIVSVSKNKLVGYDPKPQVSLYIPLDFCFGRSTKFVLPYVWIPENVRINVQFRSLEELSDPKLLKK